MSLSFEARVSDSPYIESVTRGWTLGQGRTIRPAEIHWHMIFEKHPGSVRAIVVGPLTSSGIVRWGQGAEILWIKFKLGVFMPHLPTRNYLDEEQVLPEVSRERFWWKGAALQFPTFENVETFVDRLRHEEDLVHDPVVTAALQDQLLDVSPRTVRHRFLQATGQTQSHIRQYERAIKAASLLRHGVSIADTVFEAGYFDQPHLTRSLKQFIGYTPAQILAERNP
ncbi:MAG TPA: helix-turn-helix domain-containing protein [Anaerolineales bacterium]|nr:helix-turn-helix domain-containing protein [Anaerolineales bacterium]